MSYFIIQGSRKHWKWSVIDYFFKISNYVSQNNVLVWGFNKKSYYEKVNVNDTVYFRTNRNGSPDSGVFGKGKVIEKFEDDKNYWPDEFEGGRRFRWRIKIGEIIWSVGLEEKLKQLEIKRDIWKNNLAEFFSSREFEVDIFHGTLINKFYGQGSIISIDEKEVMELDNFLTSTTRIERGVRTTNLVEFILKIYEEEKRIALKALKNKKNVILIGPPGSGKTVLAQKLGEEYSNETGGNGYLLYTVHSGTDYFDLVARIVPSIDSNERLFYKREKRYLLDALLNKKVLILDEINRTQIDTALGIFFTYLEFEHRIKNVDQIHEILKKEVDEDIPPEELKEKLEFFRVIGTLNIYDKTFLFKLGDALRRRFVFINIMMEKEKMEKIKNNFETFLECIGFDGDRNIAQRLLSIFEKINEKKELGIGILKDLISFSTNYENENDAIENSLIHIVLPFFENDTKWLDVDSILKAENLNKAKNYLRKLNYASPTS